MTVTLSPEQRVELIDSYCQLAPIIPVISISAIEHAIPLCNALVEGGLKVLEITLRTEHGLESIRQVRQALPDAIVAAGTVTTKEQLVACEEAGAHLVVTPGCTPELLEAGMRGSIPILPGISSISEMMVGLERGYRRFKFFPAEASGGATALRAFSGPFPDIYFCPTGGIKLTNMHSYLDLKNVMCVGGTWLTPEDLIANSDWEGIKKIAEDSIKASTLPPL